MHDAAVEQRMRLLGAVWSARAALDLPGCLRPARPTRAAAEGCALDLAMLPDGAELVLRDRVGAHPGAALLEAPLLAVFLPALCRALLGEALLLRSAPVWWFGDRSTLAMVAAAPRRFRIGNALDPDQPPQPLAALDPAARARLQRAVDEAPDRFVATLQLDLPTRRLPVNPSLSAGCFNSGINSPEKSDVHPRHPAP